MISSYSLMVMFHTLGRSQSKYKTTKPKSAQNQYLTDEICIQYNLRTGVTNTFDN